MSPVLGGKDNSKKSQVPYLNKDSQNNTKLISHQLKTGGFNILPLDNEIKLGNRSVKQKGINQIDQDS